MSYIEHFEAELTTKLYGSKVTGTIIRWVSGKVLESYKNGITAGRKSATVIRHGKSRSSGSPSQAQ